MSATPLTVACEENAVLDLVSVAAPFKDLPRPVLAAICETAEVRRYSAGETAYSTGQFDGGEFLLVSRGRLQAAFADPDSSALLIEEIGAGGLFFLAETVAGGNHPRAERVTLTAEKDSEVVAFDAEAFRGVIARRPLLTRNLMLYFAQALVRARTEPAPSELSAERRVFAALLEYVERDAVSGDWRVTRMPKHRELGEKAGADEATTANAIARLIQAGIARREYPGLVIDDIGGLNRLAS